MKSLFTRISSKNSPISFTSGGFKSVKSIVQSIFVFTLILFGSQRAAGQTATVTLNYGGGGFCNVCSVQDYQCSSNSTGGWTPNRIFTDPTPAGSVITGISAQYYAVCDGGTFNVLINGTPVASGVNSGWSCQCNSCSGTTVSSNSSAVVNAYNYGGINTWTTNVSNGGVDNAICVDRIVLTISYTSCSTPTISSLSFNPNPVCVGGSTSLNINGSLNDATHWNVYAGSCGGTLVGATSGSSLAIGQPYNANYFVRGEGNCIVSSVCTQVTGPIMDNVLPTAVCQNATVSLNSSGTASVSASQINNGSSDNCTVSTVSLSPTTFNCSNLGNNSVTLTVTDNNSNVRTCNAIVTVEDNITPTISCPSNITVNNTTNQCGKNVTYTIPTGNDNCSGFSVSRIAGPASGSFFGVGTTTVTHRVTDSSGNTAQCSFTVTVNDNQNPTISCPANISTTASSGTCARNVSFSNPSVSDNCTASLTSLSPASGSSFALGTTTVSATATDASGNTANCTFTVTVTDNQVPTITCPSDQTVNASSGMCTALVNYPTPTGADNCPGVTIARTAGPASGSLFSVGPTTVTYVATDGNAQTATCSFVITVVDNQNPTISCPGNIITGNDAGQCSAVVNWTAPTGADNCPGVTTALSAGQNPNTSFGLGTTGITYTATDAAGNTASCSFNVTVNDTEDPVISCPSNIVTDNDPGSCTAIETFVTPTPTDNCPGVSVLQVAGSASGSPFPEGTQTVTFRATDGAGNTADCSFTIEVNDNEAPVFYNCPTPVNISVGTDAGVCTATVVYPTLGANDNCDGPISPVQTAGLGSGATFPEGVTTETWTATDGEGNIGTCSFTVTVTDDESPQLNCPSNQTVTFDASCQYELLDYTGQVGFLADNCDASPTVTQSPSATTVITGSTEITMTAEDAEGNDASCTFFVNPNDVVDPTITCPADQPVNVNSICQFTLPDYTTTPASDDCDPSPVVTQVPSIGSILTSTQNVVLTVTDAAGNTSTCNFNAIPNDATAPVITCPANQLEAFDADCEFDLDDYTALPTVNDNCDASPTVTQSPAISTTITGPQVVTLTATDANNNSSSCTFSVIPDDTTDPVVTCPADLPVSFNAQCLYNIVDYTGSATATDNCDNALTLTQSPIAGTSVGTTTIVQITATDDDGNSGSCTFNVIPADNTPPSISCPSDQIVNANATCQFTLANYVNSVVTNDNCGTPVVTQSPAAASTQSGTTTVTMTSIHCW